MSEKNFTELEEILKEIREDIGFHFDRFEKTNSKADELRFYFSVTRYYEILSREEDNEDNRLLYQRSKENYERLFPNRDVFSMNRKV